MELCGIRRAVDSADIIILGRCYGNMKEKRKNPLYAFFLAEKGLDGAPIELSGLRQSADDRAVKQNAHTDIEPQHGQHRHGQTAVQMGNAAVVDIN